VTKTIEKAMETNENKYKNILNHQGNVNLIDFDSLTESIFLFSIVSVLSISFSSLFDFDHKPLVRLKS
jgi:hypothetical protein